MVLFLYFTKSHLRDNLFGKDFLVKTTFTQSDFADFGKQVFKTILAEKRAIFHAFFVDNITSNGVIPQNGCRPIVEKSLPFWN